MNLSPVESFPTDSYPRLDSQEPCQAELMEREQDNRDQLRSGSGMKGVCMYETGLQENYAHHSRGCSNH